MAPKKKRPRGRPRVDATIINVRMPKIELDALDAWIKREGIVFSRNVAIRMIVAKAIR